MLKKRLNYTQTSAKTYNVSFIFTPQTPSLQSTVHSQALHNDFSVNDELDIQRFSPHHVTMELNSSCHLATVTPSDYNKAEQHLSPKDRGSLKLYSKGTNPNT